MLSLESVTKVFHPTGQRAVEAVRGVNLHVERHDFLVITGRSGSGKTTLLHLAAGLTRPTGGNIRIEDTDLWEIGERGRSSLRSHKIGFVFQFPSLLPSLTALENIVLPTSFCRERDKSQARRRASELLEMVGLAGKLNSLPGQLSAEEQQRVVIARSLVNDPQLLLADEPTSNLDEETEQEIMQLLKTIHSSMGMTVLLVTHASQSVSFGTGGLRMVDGILQPQ